MDTTHENSNHLEYRFSDFVLKKCNALLEINLKKVWMLESAYAAYVRDCAERIKSEHLRPVIEQFIAEEEQQLKRLGKIGEVLNLDFAASDSVSNNDINLLMAPSQSVLSEFSGFEFVSQWILILEFEKLVHYKMAHYQSMVGWTKFLRLYGIQELLEDSLDEYIQQDLILNLLSETWEG